ncbi:M14 family metallopeptidase [Ulvibacter antarcticus]|uniref:Zinc carboxypeptidase n=1 Tax=Ulvibacter antarcticus TaxID=442714 RepID=A0A3L9YVX5_9FLAO|nr:M14 metallopeptidase family protein [Ulvibacter antarcticus]RMA64474.1 zinc carboxypeptidase [Ulvibacter antarcticus]
MNIVSWYTTYFEARISGRYITLNHILPILDSYKNSFEISVAGTSELGKNIPLIKIGNGKKRVLGWSQMHGNESTTTKAIFDFLKFIDQKEFFQKEIQAFLNEYTFFIIPILNPDGAKLYTRVNSNKIDLNRDAKDLSQKESKVIRKVFEEIKPDICLNLHDQRSIYGVDTGKSATVSFLAPSADAERSVTASRVTAMEHIVRMNQRLQRLIPKQIGRYDDGFNQNCIGDTFQMLNVPTILFEAGHYENDYNREVTREFIFYAYLELFGITNASEDEIDYKDYFKIPQNEDNFRDLILRNVGLVENGKPVDIVIHFSEVLEKNKIKFHAVIEGKTVNTSLKGHKEIDLKGERILINSHKNIDLGQNVTTIVKESDTSFVIFPLK